MIAPDHNFLPLGQYRQLDNAMCMTLAVVSSVLADITRFLLAGAETDEDIEEVVRVEELAKLPKALTALFDTMKRTKYR